MTKQGKDANNSNQNTQDSKPVFKNQRKSAYNLKLIPYKVWILSAAVAICLVALLLWSIFGHVTTRVYAKGVLLPGDSRIYYAASPEKAIVKRILVKRGEHVDKGQTIAKLYTPLLQQKIKQQKSFLNDLKNQASAKSTDQLKRKIVKARNRLAILKLKNQYRHTIKSPVSGRIISVASHKGMLTKAGKPIVLIGEDADHMNAFVLFPALQGKRIKPSMKAYISPTYVNKYQYGAIEGHVKDISSYPVSKESILSVVSENSWLDNLGFHGEAMFMGRVQLDHNANTPSGLQWTSSQGPDMSIGAGSFVNVEVVVKRQAPITLVIPLLRTWFTETGS